MPKVEESFVIDQPAAQVWPVLQDVPRVVTCMPGLELVDQPDAETYVGKVTMKMGPVTAAFEGEAKIVERDDGAMRARIDSKGVDKRGGSRASASVVYWLDADEGRTTVNIEGDIKLTGALAQMGRTGIIVDVARHVIGQFADGLREELARNAAAESPSGARDAVPTQSDRAVGAIRAERLLVAILWRKLMALLAALVRPFAGGRRSS